MIESLLRKMAAIEWTWSASDVPRLMQALGGELMHEVRGRKTYALADELKADAYLHAGSIVAIEVVLEVVRSVRTGARKHRELAAQAATVLGAPDFEGSRDEAIELAVWKRKNVELMVELRQEDRDVPIRLQITRRRRATKRTTKSIGTSPTISNSIRRRSSCSYAGSRTSRGRGRVMTRCG